MARGINTEAKLSCFKEQGREMKGFLLMMELLVARRSFHSSMTAAHNVLSSQVQKKREIVGRNRQMSRRHRPNLPTMSHFLLQPRKVHEWVLVMQSLIWNCNISKSY